MKRRSVVATMLAAAMALSLTACGSKSADTAQTTAAAGTDTTAAADANTTSDWPKQTITMICGFGAGGSSDLGVRSLASSIEKQTGVSCVVQNVTGANGWMAWSQLLHSKPDGYTIALVNTPALFTDYLDPQQGHKETMDDFDFICNHVTDTGLLVAKTGKYADMAAFMKAAESDGGVTVGDVGANGNKHIATLQLQSANEGSTLTPVHQSGWSDNYAAVLGDSVDAVSATYGDVASVLADGDVQVLCVFAKERLDVLPDVPTCEEAAFGSVISEPSRGYMLPKGVDAATKAKIEEVFEKAIENEDHQADMANLGLIVNYVGGEDYLTMLKSQEQDIIALKPELGWK